MNNNFKNEVTSKLNSDILNLISELNLYAEKTSVKLFFVGGLVRDLIMGSDISDIDILVEGSAIDFCTNCGICEILSIHKDFGTVKARVMGYDIDFASTRSEYYPSSGSLPTVSKIGVSLLEDVKRRDFTVNAIALSLSDFSLVDYLGGADDIQSKTLKILHKNSFIDDPTRILRGLDFSIRFGFEFDDFTRTALASYLTEAPNLRDGLSLSRVELTLDKVLRHGEIAYKSIISNKYYKIFRDDEPQIEFEKIKRASEMFSVSQAELLKFALLGTLPVLQADLSSDYKIYQTFKKYSDFELAKFYMCDIYSSEILNYYTNLKDISLNLTGADLIGLGFEQGKFIGDILNSLLEYRINTKIELSREEEIAFVTKNFKK